MLSIIVPTFNEEKYLPRLLTSIKQQTFSDYQIIIADNHSTDTTRLIAQAFQAQIVEGGLPGAGRNNGAKIAQRDTLLFLDADVILPDPFFLQASLAEFWKRNLGVATCGVKPLSSKKIDLFSHQVYNLFVRSTAKILPHAPGFCIFAQTKIHRAIDGFDERIKLGEDSDYVYRAARISNFGVLNADKIPVSVRRLERDGRLNVIIKYILCGIHMRIFGNVESNIFNYTFGHSK